MVSSLPLGRLACVLRLAQARIISKSVVKPTVQFRGDAWLMMVLHRHLHNEG